MLKALGDQADGAPPLYYFLVRAWAVVFSSSELSLRLFSTATFCAALALVWLTVRRVFDFWPSAFAVSLAIGTNDTLRFENSNIRFYGLFFALIALAVFLAIELGVRERPRVQLILANILTQAALVLCHPLGLFYAGFLLLAVVLGDIYWYRKIRWTVIASYFAGWMAILLWLHQLLRQADIGRPHGWVPVPDLSEIELINNSFVQFERLVWALIAVCTLQFFTSKRGPTVRSDFAHPTAALPSLAGGQRQCRLLLAGFSLLLMIPFLWVLSRLMPTNALFVARYLIGTTIGWAILMAELSQLVLALPEIQPKGLAAFRSAILPFFVLLNLSSLPAHHNLQREGLSGNYDSAYGHLDLPIVCLRSHDFMPRWHYSADADRYYFLLDWPVASAPDNPLRAAVVDYKILAAAGRNYVDLYHGHIVNADEFLATHSSFLVEDVPQSPWVSARLKPDQYAITHLQPDRPVATDQEGVWPMLLVEKKEIQH